MRAKRGFTLLELLIVIGIIGTLAGLLIPVVDGAMEAVKLSTCKNNLLFMGRALNMYRVDSGRGVLFPRRSGAAFLTYLYGSSATDTAESKTFICPATFDDNAQGIRLTNIPPGDPNNDVSYCGRKNPDPSVYPGLFSISTNTTITTLGGDDWNQPAPTETNHTDTSNFLFLDFHVEDLNFISEEQKFFFALDPLTN